MANILVETFEQEDVEKHPEACDEAKKLIKELGLKGQTHTATENGQRLPYRCMTAEEARVYRILCDATTRLEYYDADTVPLRVLQIISHAKSLNVFEGFEIWHPSTYIKDPILTAWLPGKQYHTRYILARWGEHLDEFSVLAKKAAAINYNNVLTRCREIQTKITAKLAYLQSIEDKESTFVSMPSFYEG